MPARAVMTSDDSTTSDQLYLRGVEAYARIQPGSLDLLRASLEDDPANVQAALALKYWTPDPRERAALNERLPALLPDADGEVRAMAALVDRLPRLSADAVAGAVATLLSELPSSTFLWLIAVDVFGDGSVRGGWRRLIRLCRELDSDAEPLDLRLGRLGFALHESHCLDEAEDCVRAALRLRRDSGYAMHSLMHILYETSRHDEGLEVAHDWLTGVGAGTPIRSHFAWHAAIHAAALGKTRHASELLRGPVLRPPSPAGFTVDAPSLAWRLQLQGAIGAADVAYLRSALDGIALTELSPLAAASTAFGLAVLADVDALAALEKACRRRADPRMSTAADVAPGLRLWCRGEWAPSAAVLARAKRERWRLGGSQIQQQTVAWTARAAAAKSRACSPRSLARRARGAPSHRGLGRREKTCD